MLCEDILRNLVNMRFWRKGTVVLVAYREAQQSKYPYTKYLHYVIRGVVSLHFLKGRYCGVCVVRWLSGRHFTRVLLTNRNHMDEVTIPVTPVTEEIVVPTPEVETAEVVSEVVVETPAEVEVVK